jgi:two-component system OmpR family response regulator
MQAILIIEDNVDTARYLELELQQEGYTVTVEMNGQSGLKRALEDNWDLILLDIMLPELNGMEILRRVRKEAPALPIIMVSARSETPDVVSGLDNGANDYIIKPFIIEELLARVRACLRTPQFGVKRNDYISNEQLTVDGLTLNRKTREVIRENKHIELTMKEFDLLVFLIQNKPNVMTREQIILEVWGYAFVGDTNIVDVYIRYLRKKINYNFSVPLIQTIRGIGYCIRDEA